MTTYAVIASYNSDSRRPDYASGTMAWDLREDRWRTIDVDDGTTTTTQNEQEALDALDTAAEDRGALFDLRILAVDDDTDEADPDSLENAI
jgi:hypothetical protein